MKGRKSSSAPVANTVLHSASSNARTWMTLAAAVSRSPLHNPCCSSSCQSQGVFFQEKLEANPVGHRPAVRLVPRQWAPENLTQQDEDQEGRP